MRRMNERTVLETIRAGAPISRAEISRRVGDLEADRVARAPVAARRRARRASAAKTGRATARRSSSRSPTRRPCSGSTSARASCAARSATCAATCARAQDIEHAGRRRRAACRRRAEAEVDLVARRARPPRGRRRRRPGVIEPRAAPRACRGTSRGLEGLEVAAELAAEPRPAGDAVENDVNLAAVGEHGEGSRGASTTSSSGRLARASGRGSYCAASCTAATTARQARSTTRWRGPRPALDPCASAL